MVSEEMHPLKIRDTKIRDSVYKIARRIQRANWDYDIAEGVLRDILNLAKKSIIHEYDYKCALKEVDCALAKLRGPEKCVEYNTNIDLLFDVFYAQQMTLKGVKKCLMKHMR